MKTSSISRPISDLRGARALGRFGGQRFILPAIAVLAAAGAMLVLTLHADGAALDYGTGLVPIAVPWVAAVLVVIVAVTGLTRLVTSPIAGLFAAALTVATGWSVAVLLFDALRVVRLVPLPLSGWGLGLRLLLLVGAAAAVQPVLHASQVRRGRCQDCSRWLPGPLARIPRWPVAVGIAFALPYPVLRVVWLLGGTVGKTGGPEPADPSLQLVMAAVGTLLVALAVVLLVGRGPAWLRAILGLGGVVAGVGLACTFGPAAAGVAGILLAHGLDVPPAAGLSVWVFALFYGSWTLAGIGVALGGLRYWIHRRADCASCRRLIAADTSVAEPAEPLLS